VKARHIPNLISILRILLVVPLAFFLLSKNYLVAFGLFFLAGISDALDGYLARRFNWSSRLGALLDPVGDKLLMITSYLILGGQEHLPIWLVVTVILRDVIIVTGGLAYRVMIGEVAIEPILSSKVNTALQIALMAIVLFSLSIVAIPELVDISQKLDFLNYFIIDNMYSAAKENNTTLNTALVAKYGNDFPR
jgi:cardiolipin synthase